MGPIIIWPPGVCDGFFPGCDNPDPNACQEYVGANYYDCTAQYPSEADGGIACCSWC